MHGLASHDKNSAFHGAQEQGARVYIDGRDKGTLTLDLRSGAIATASETEVNMVLLCVW